MWPRCCRLLDWQVHYQSCDATVLPQEPVQHCVIGAPNKDAIEASLQDPDPFRAGVLLPRIESGIEPPDLRTLGLDGLALRP